MSESRAIDLAKTASIDMMGLNNKVVNMRQVVKRTKVQVINKLCKNIASLKKKKGSEEQKAQNLRKAERFIEEIDSIKHLKEDKVSKYALANTTTFKDVSKISTAAGPRAMARLTDHPIMQKVVEDFRVHHPDWRDLAAYLLVKQTGRRFKTKKQKQRNKLTRTVENIHASETMTKAYIQERFGKAGLDQAERRFQQRKRKLDSSTNETESANEDSSTIKTRPDEPSHKQCKKEENMNDLSNIDVKQHDDHEESSGKDETPSSEQSDDALSNSPSKKKPDGSEIKAAVKNDEAVHKKISGKVSTESLHQKHSEKVSSTTSSSEDETSDIETLVKSEIRESISKEDSNRETESEDDSKETDEAETISKETECVIRELNFDKQDSTDSVDQKHFNVSITNEKSSDSESEPSSDRNTHPKKKRKNKIPTFLKGRSKAPIADPFFAGSDDDGEDDTETCNDFDAALSREPGDEEDFSGSSRRPKSMFYNPQRSGYQRDGARGRGRGQRQEVGRGGAQSWERSRGRGSRGPSRGAWRGGRSERSDYRDKNRFDNSRQPKDEGNFKQAPVTSSEKLHPSWEASKKRKAEQSGIQAFKGSKITFDDDS